MACVRKLNVCETFLLLIVTRTCEIKALAASWVIGCKSFALQGTHVFVERSKSTKSKEKKTRKVMSITSVVICERKEKAKRTVWIFVGSGKCCKWWNWDLIVMRIGIHESEMWYRKWMGFREQWWMKSGERKRIWRNFTVLVGIGKRVMVMEVWLRGEVEGGEDWEEFDSLLWSCACLFLSSISYK